MRDTSSRPPGTDPYGALGLRPGAPRDLIEEAYWFLVAQQSTCGSPEIERTERLLQLNQAYEDIVRGGVTHPVRTHTVPARRRWQRRSERAVEWLQDPFETLYLRRDAEGELAVVASRVLSSYIPRGLKTSDWDAILQKAVSDVYAHHERMRGASAEPVDVPGDHREDDAPEQAPESGEPATAREPEASGVDAVEGAPAAAGADAVEQAGEDLESAAGEREPDQRAPDVLEVEAKADDPVSPEEALVEAVVDAGIATPAGESESAEPNRAPSEPAEPERAAASKERGARSPLIERVLGRSARAESMQTHLQERLLQLRDAPTRAATEPATQEHRKNGRGASRPTPAPARQTLEVLSSRDVTEDGLDITLGAGPDAAALRVWRRGDMCLLQQLSGAVVLVNGQPLQSPIVVLEDSDQIRHEDNVLTLQDA